jgi:CheY-like chemotaxis protein
VSGRILIADGDAARGEGLRAACQARGFAAEQVGNGAGALELALASLPDLIVATGELPLIDANRLIEILRANPRTQGIPFLLLGAAIETDREGALDERLASDALPEDVAQLADAMLTRQSRLDDAAHEPHDEGAISGQLTQISLLDLVQLLHLNRRTGSVELTQHDASGRTVHGRVFLRDGDLVQAQTGAVEGEKALYRLLAWREGSFSFNPTPVQVSTRITASTRALLIEGTRHLDEWERVRGALPGLDAQVRLKLETSELPNVVQPLTQEVLLLLEIYSRVGDVVDRCGYPDYQVLRTLQTLSDRGIVEVTQEPAAEPATGTGRLLKPAQVRRLQERLATDAPRPGGRLQAKLVLAASDPDCAREFLRLLAATPGLRLEAGAQKGLVFGPVATLDLEEGAEIEILAVPVAQGFEPLWPLASYAALASLVLIGGGDPNATAAVAAASARLRELSASRTHHVVLAREGEELDPEGIRERLGLTETEPLFTVPHGAQDPLEVLRTLFARMLS